MGGIWVVGEVDAAGALTKLSCEAATAARSLADAAKLDVRGVVVAAEPDAAATSMAAFLPVVTCGARPGERWSGRLPPSSQRGLPRWPAAAAEPPAYVVVGATPDGRDLAGALAALLGVGVLVGATGLAWGGRGGRPARGPAGGDAAVRRAGRDDERLHR